MLRIPKDITIEVGVCGVEKVLSQFLSSLCDSTMVSVVIETCPRLFPLNDDWTI